MDHKKLYICIILFIFCLSIIGRYAYGWLRPGATEEYQTLQKSARTVREIDIANPRDPNATRKASEDKFPVVLRGDDSPDFLSMEDIAWPHYSVAPYNWESPPNYGPDWDTGQYVGSWPPPDTGGPWEGFFVCPAATMPREVKCEQWNVWDISRDSNTILLDLSCINCDEIRLATDGKIYFYVPLVDDYTTVTVMYTQTMGNYPGPPSVCQATTLVRCPEECVECFDEPEYAPNVYYGSTYIAPGGYTQMFVSTSDDETPSCGPWTWETTPGYRVVPDTTYVEFEAVKVISEDGSFCRGTVTVTDDCGLETEVNVSSSPSVSDEFIGENGDFPDDCLWTEVGGNSVIHNGKLRLNISGGNGNLISKWNLTGEFNYQAVFTIETGPKKDAWRVSLYARNVDSGDYGYVTYGAYDLGVDNPQYYYTFFEKIGEGDPALIHRELTGLHAGGTFGIIRDAANEITLSVGGISKTLDLAGEIEVYLVMTSTGDFDPAVILDYDEFILNSGTVVWPP